MTRGEIQAFVFDMDGTLLHTMPDLAVAANEALRQMGFPAHTQDEMLQHMGRGGQHLIERIVPPSASAVQRQQAFGLWREIYIESDYSLAEPFEGVVEALRELRGRGARLGILSNKFDAGVRLLAERHFPGLFDLVRGDAPPMPRKPDPTSLLWMLGELGVDRAQSAYVGDSVVDVRVARNAGVKAIGVCWGYDNACPLLPEELDAYIGHPSELLGFMRR